jgi:hypothetical protein
MNKRGRFIWPRSLLWLVSGAVFLYLALMPFFDVFPYNFEIGEGLLRVLIVVVGILILIESFRRERGFKNFSWVIIGILIAAFGIYIFLMGLNISLPFVFGINEIVLQIILALYSLYLIWGSFGQVKIVE